MIPLLAADTPIPPEWIAYFMLGGGGLLLWLLLRGELLRKAEFESRLEEIERRTTIQVADATRHAREIETSCRAQLAEKDRLLDAVNTRLDAVVADREAWKHAHSEEVEARRSVERNSERLLESTQLSVALLSALKEVLASRGGSP